MDLGGDLGSHYVGEHAARRRAGLKLRLRIRDGSSICARCLILNGGSLLFLCVHLSCIPSSFLSAPAQTRPSRPTTPISMNTTHRNITADEDLELRMTTAVSQNPNDQGRSSCALAESSSTHRPPAPTSTPTAQCTATPANTSSDSQPFPTLSTHPDDAPEQTRSSSKEEDHGEHPHAQRPSLLRRATHRLPQPDLILLNSGSVARDHLASERTFLAYVRTSLTLVTMGVG